MLQHKLVILTACILLQACSKVDDYMLGKDNTPVPATLKPLTSKATLVEQWSLPVGDRNNTSLKLKPEIKDHIIYTATANGFMQAIEKNSGRLIWSKKLSRGIISGPTVAMSTIALSTDSSTILLLNQTDGNLLWESNVSGDVLSKPVISGSKVIAKTVDGNLYAFDLKTGKKLWLSAHGAPNLILKASSSPTVVNNKLVLVGYSDGKMDAVDFETGRLVWQTSIAYANGSSDVERLVDIDADPIIRDNVAYLASYQGYVGALSLTDGQFIWRKPASVYKNMAIDNKMIYLTDSDDIIWAINRLNGNVNWKQPALKARGLTEPVLLGDRLIVGDNTGLLHVIAIQNGDLISRVHVAGGAVTTAPLIADRNVYVMSSSGKLSRFSVS